MALTPDDVVVGDFECNPNLECPRVWLMDLLDDHRCRISADIVRQYIALISFFMS